MYPLMLVLYNGRKKCDLPNHEKLGYGKWLEYKFFKLYENFQCYIIFRPDFLSFNV